MSRHKTIITLLVLLGFIASILATDTDSSWAPEQIHVSLGDTHHQMYVLWATCRHVSSWVTYGKDGQPLDMWENGTMTYLSQNGDMACRYIHRAVLQDLEEGTKYRYQVHSAKDSNVITTNLTTRHTHSPLSPSFSSPVYTFTTLSADQTKPVSFLVYGDLGVEGNDTFPALQRELDIHNHSALWHVGDMAYDLADRGGWVGDDFLRKLEPVAANIPYMVAPGNHEIEYDSFQHYKSRFSTPGASWPIPTSQMWYSYDIGLAHVISYSTEVFFTNHETYECIQFYWLLHDLQKANGNRDKVPWVIAMGHRPMYCSNRNMDDCTGLFFLGRVKAGLEDLFHAQGVDLIIEAHEHSYERTWPMYDNDVIQTNYVNPRGSVHVISGAAGNKEGTDRMKTSIKPWSAYRHASRHDNNFGRLHVVNHTHLFWQQVRVRDSEVFDQFWLVQNAHGPFVDGDVSCLTDDAHHSCSCPLPFFVWVILVVSGVLVGLGLLVLAIVLCVKRTSLIQRCCTISKTARACDGEKNGWWWCWWCFWCQQKSSSSSLRRHDPRRKNYKKVSPTGESRNAERDHLGEDDDDDDDDNGDYHDDQRAILLFSHDDRYDEQP